MEHSCFLAFFKKGLQLFFQLCSQVCRDECELLEYGLCHKELAIARSQPLINHQVTMS